MRLVWHIVRKDMRRLALPMVAWLVLIVVPALAFRLTSPTVEGHVASSISTLVGGASIWIRLVVAIQLLIGYVLAGALVMEDSIVETNGFWLTRPIGKARLLAAKLFAAIILFIVAPVVALAPIWFASGFSVLEVWSAGCEFAKVQGTVTLLALAVASLARNLAQVLLYTVAFGVANFLCLWLTGPFFRDVAMPVRLSRYSVTLVIELLVLGWILAQQFLTRRTARGWITAALAFVACLGVNAAWPWDVWTGIAARVRATRFEERPEDRAAQIVAEPAFTKFRRGSNELPTLFVTAPWAQGKFYIPVFLKFSDDQIARGASGPGSTDAGLRVLGFQNEETPLRWQVMMTPAMNSATDEPHFAGMLEVWAVRPRVMGETSLRVGAQISHGANRTRILELGRKEERLDEIFIEERDAASALVGGWSTNWSTTDVLQLRYIDQYFLVDRATRKAQRTYASDVGSIEISSMVKRFRRLHVSGTDDWHDGVLVKLRFECDHRFERPIEVKGITIRGPSTTP